MKLSVAMATYNGEKYITEQLDSIRMQSRKVDEVIIQDDRSSDRTAEIVSSYIQEHGLEDTWKIQVNPENLGYASNFVGALRKTTGDLIFFCDQDDIWMPDRIAKMTEVMEQNPKILLLGSEFEPFASTADAPSVPAWELAGFSGDGTLEPLAFTPRNIFIGCQGCTMCMRRTLLEKTDAYWYAGWAHDEYVWKLALCLDGLYFYHQPTLRRRLHSSNVTLHTEHQAQKRLKYLEDLLKSHQKTLSFALDEGLDEDRIRLLKKNVRATQLRIRLIHDRKVLLTFPLMMHYADCYHKKRSIPVELCMAVKGY